MQNLKQRILNNSNDFTLIQESEDKFGITYLGFKLNNKHIVYWFKTYNSGEDAYYFFDHSYSMNNAKICKGLNALPKKVWKLLID